MTTPKSGRPKAKKKSMAHLRNHGTSESKHINDPNKNRVSNTNSNNDNNITTTISPNKDGNMGHINKQ